MRTIESYLFRRAVCDVATNSLNKFFSSVIARLATVREDGGDICEAFAFFVATAGAEFEDYQMRLKDDDDMVRTFIADAFGSVMAERTADLMEQALQDEISPRGWLHTNRFSPGYCGWHVSGQQQLFRLFGVERPCGVSLTESSLMLPIKSVSGVIGIGPKVRKLEYSCGLCDYKDCYKRRKRM